MIPRTGETCIAALMMIGAKPEPFLEACLESVADAVDLLVLNDNSGLDEHPNLAAVRESRLWRSDRVRVIASEFKGFGYCRTLCLDWLRERMRPGLWVFYLDADEVHPPNLPVVTRSLLPALPQDVGIVDGYKYEFFQSPGYYISLDRRHNLFFRFTADVRWEGVVHEKPVGMTGTRIAIPYVYFHYGYITPPEWIKEKWKFYGTLGDGMSATNEEGDGGTFVRDAKRALRFTGAHPAVAGEALAKICGDEDFAGAFAAIVKQHGMHPASGLLARLNFSLRPASRIVEFLLRYGKDARLRSALFALLRNAQGPTRR